MAIHRIPLAGIGSPLKYLLCDSSMLNRARRHAPASAIMNGSTKIHFSRKVSGGMAASSIFIARKDGTNPNVTQSASESSCFPSGDDTFNRRATMPSKKSNTAAMKMKRHANSILEVTKAMHPQSKLPRVMKLGMLDLMFKIDNFLRKIIIRNSRFEILFFI